MRNTRAALGNRKLFDYDELRDVVISHRLKTKNVPDCFISQGEDDHMLNEYV
ncbi:MAG: hypothetical protein R6U32_00235 [Candidatus Woesearchaeota archaeon]